MTYYSTNNKNVIYIDGKKTIFMFYSYFYDASYEHCKHRWGESFKGLKSRPGRRDHPLSPGAKNYLRM